jgi:hypothetical protein
MKSSGQDSMSITKLAAPLENHVDGRISTSDVVIYSNSDNKKEPIIHHTLLP